MPRLVNKLASLPAPAFDETRGCLLIRASSEVPDSDDEVVIPSTLRLDRYKLNPVVILVHNQQRMPIAKCEDEDGQFRAWIDDNGDLMEEWYFSNSAEGQGVAALYRERVLRGASIGFIDDGIAYLSPMDAMKRYKVNRRLGVYRGGELTETSAVPVPSCPLAIAQQWVDADMAQSVVSRGMCGGERLTPTVTKALMAAMSPRRKIISCMLPPLPNKLRESLRLKGATAMANATSANGKARVTPAAVDEAVAKAAIDKAAIDKAAKEAPDAESGEEDNREPHEHITEGLRMAAHKAIDGMFDGSMEAKACMKMIQDIHADHEKYMVKADEPDESTDDEEPAADSDDGTEEKPGEDKAAVAGVTKSETEAEEPGADDKDAAEWSEYIDSRVAAVFKSVLKEAGLDSLKEDMEALTEGFETLAGVKK